MYLEQPERLFEFLAESLFRLHQINFFDCPNRNGLEEMMFRASENYQIRRVEKGLLHYIGYENIEIAYKDM